MKRPIVCLFVSLVGSVVAHAETQLIQAFEGDGFDSWQTTGNAFGLAPVSGKAPGMAVEFTKYSGSAYVCSGHGGDAATGTLTSPRITLSHPYLGFLVGGGNRAGQTAVQLVVDGVVVREAVGRNDLILRPEVWDVSAWKGKTAIIRIVDEAKDRFGLIAADHFVFSSEATPEFPQTVTSRGTAEEPLVRVEGEGSAAVPKGVKFLVTGAHEQTGVTSPTAIAFGNDGSLYVAETNRFRFGVEDDRGNLYWYHDDLAAKTVADRRALHEKWWSKRSKEWMTAKTETIRHLSGASAEGVFTKSKVFAEQFNDVLDGTAAGVFAWDETVYFACIPKLWMLRDPKGDGTEAGRKVIEEGFGVRVSLSGHDMNGFALGYDGRVWGTIGDRGFDVRTKEGRRFDFHNQGAVFRFEPDGTQFEVFHTGLRNPKELAFDEWGNGISVDNNSDQGDQARVVYVVEGADSGWEMEHQAMHTFHREIGLEKRPPSRWMTERAWEMQNPVQPQFLVPPAAHISSGPSGLTYHPGVGFLESEARHFLICDYRGSAGSSGIFSFQMAPYGAGMRMKESHKLLWGVCATDVEYDWQGRLVVSDFIGGWQSHEKGRVVTLTAGKVFQAERAQEAAELMREGFSKRSSEELAKWLAHPDQRVRLRAQLELTRRSDAAERFEAATRSENALERVHGIWGLGILARRGAAIRPGAVWDGNPEPVAPLAVREAAARRLVPLLGHADAEVRAQTIRMLGEAPLQGNTLPFAALLKDGSLRVRSFAAIAAGKLGAYRFVPEVLAMLREYGEQDPVIRHSGVFALERLCKTPEAMDALGADADANVRMAAVIVLRRRADAGVSRFLGDVKAAVADEAIRAIHDLSLEAGRPAVAALLDRRGEREWTPFMLRRLVHSAFRLGGVQNATRLAHVAVDVKMPGEVRTEALRLLGMWTNPFPVDQSTGHWAPLPARDLSEVQPGLNAVLPQLLQGDSETLRVALELVPKYRLEVSALPSETLIALAGNEKLSGAARAKALEMYLSRKTADAAPVAQRFAEDAKDEVAMVAIGELAQRDPVRGVAELRKAVGSGSAARQQGAWKALGRLEAAGVEALFVEGLKGLEAAKGVSPAALELMEVAAMRKEGAVLAALSELQKSLASGSDPIARWMPALEGGNAENGFALFQAHPGGQCLRCHRASDDGHAAGGEAGPNLAGVAKRGDRRYLLESIVASSAVVVSGYGTVNMELVNGGLLTGTLLKESADAVDVDVSGQAWRVARKDVKSMSAPVSGMPLMDGVLSPSEVRDLVAWLVTLEKGGGSKKAPEPKPLDISTIRVVQPVASVDPALMQLGRQQFAMCMACHGPNGEGTVLAPPLAKSDWVNGPVENLIRIQLRGLQGPIEVSGKTYTLPAPMPAQAFQSDEQIAAVLTYVRNSFGNAASAVTPLQVRALREEVGKPVLTPAELKSPK